MCYTIFYVNVKSNICGEMSCLLKQWLVIKCTEDALHLRQCTGMYVKIYIISSSSSIVWHIVKFLFCIPNHIRKWWAGEGGTYFNGVWPRGWVLIRGNMVCACFCVVNIVLYYFRWFLLIFQVKKMYAKNTLIDITCFLLFRNKNKPVCFANSAEWDIYKVQYIRITMVL